jgi:hypothetical protein
MPYSTNIALHGDNNSIKFVLFIAKRYLKTNDLIHTVFFHHLKQADKSDMPRMNRHYFLKLHSSV